MEKSSGNCYHSNTTLARKIVFMCRLSYLQSAYVFKMNPAKQTWVNINLVRLACYIVNDKFTSHTKLLILTENVQEIINSGFYLLKEVSLLRDNDGIWSKINVNFHPFSLPLFRVFELRFSLLGHVALRERTEFFNT